MRPVGVDRLVALIAVAMWAYGSEGHRLARADLDDRLVVGARRMGLAYIAVLALTVLLALVDPVASFVLDGIVPSGGAVRRCALRPIRRSCHALRRAARDWCSSGPAIEAPGQESSGGRGAHPPSLKPRGAGVVMTVTMPTTIAMREEDWSSLVYSIERGNCILMLGPDAVTVNYEGEDLPVLTALAMFVKDKLGPEYAYLDPAKHAAVAQVAVDTEDVPILQAWVREFHELTDLAETVFDDLAALPFQLVINTSPVLGVEQAFLDAKPGTVVDYYDRTGPARPSPRDPTAEAPLIYNLYGSLEEPDSLVLSDDDRLDLLVSVITDDPPVPANVTSALRDDKMSFLFLGFSLHHWRLRLLLHVLASANGRRRKKSFALEPESAELDPETCLFYERGHKIGFLDMTLTELARELRERVAPREDAKVIDLTVQEPPPHAPLVFLCHASEDKPAVEQLHAGLQRNGIRTWFDKADLRGGDQWDSSIRQVIREVEYVVIVQSANLLAKDVGYVNREINLALDRQLEYRSRPFVLPVTIDGPDSILVDLDHIQSIDVSTPAGIDDLVRTINRDQALARRPR